MFLFGVWAVLRCLCLWRLLIVAGSCFVSLVSVYSWVLDCMVLPLVVGWIWVCGFSGVDLGC